MNLYGEFLPNVNLRFNHASKFAIDLNPSKGIRRFGPYDRDLFPSSVINCGVIYPRYATKEKDDFIKDLIFGTGKDYPGFKNLFRVDLKFDGSAVCPIDENLRSIKQAALDVSNRQCDIVFILTSQRNEQVYQLCKSILLSNGVPSQLNELQKLRTNQRPWILSNTALATYAKVGGTPWVVADSLPKQELIMGVSRAQDKNKEYVVGFVTLFNQEGDFLLLHSKTPVIKWEDYEDGLKELIIDAYSEYLTQYGIPESLIIHFHKRPGYREKSAVEFALKDLSLNIPYALLHLNEYSGFRLFDTSDNTYVPNSGLRVDLSQRQALLLLDGKENSKRTRRGVPNVWDISLDRRSTMDPQEFPRLVQQIQRFAKVNWRGFNAKSVPVTINYSKCICDIALDVGLDSWNSAVTSGKLRDKAWFL